MKKLLLLVLSISLFILLTACGNNKNNDINSATVLNEKVKTEHTANVNQNDKTENIISADSDSIVYKNKKYGFSLIFPATWKDKYYVEETYNDPETNDRIGIYHKKTWERDKAGRLFTIDIYTPKEWETKGKILADAVGVQAKYENDKAVFAITYPTDVQYVDEHDDKELFEEYKQMDKDVYKIVQSFKIEN